MNSAPTPESVSARVADVARFVVLAQGRSGSTLVVTSLAMHPRIRMHGEVFSHEESVRRGAFAGIYARAIKPGAQGEYYARGEDGESFLREVVFGAPDATRTGAAGFKLIYGQTDTDAASRRAWTYLESDPTIKIIHVRRENLMAGFVSYQTALRTKSWAVFLADEASQAVEPEPELHLERKECESYFRWVERSQKQIDASFARHPFCEVLFEAGLCRNFAATSERMQDFLGVPRISQAPVTKRQSSRPWQSRVGNFQELRSQFQGTAYARFFTGEAD